MLTPKQEQYAFRNLSLIDMERVQKSITRMEATDDEYLKEALFRDAVISYIRPFSDNRGENVKKGLKLNQKGIPKGLKPAHKEIEGIRNELFAHNDIASQNPQFGPGTGVSVKGYEKIFCDHLIEPLKKLASCVHKHIIEEMHELKKNGL